MPEDLAPFREEIAVLNPQPRTSSTIPARCFFPGSIRMKTQLHFFLCAIFATVLQGAEPAKLSEGDSAGLMQKARAVQAAFEAGDADGVLRLTHPAVLKLIGTRELKCEE
jgi:hypothetical protein